MIRFCKIKPIINQIEHHPFFQQKETIDFCSKNQIQVMAYSPLARMDDFIMNSPVLSEVATKKGKTIGQVIFRWNIQSGCVPIPGSKSELHMNENINVFDFELSHEEMEKINLLEAGKRVRFDPDKRFTLKMKIKFFLTMLKHWNEST